MALLRGINVGGRNKLPMADLRAWFEEAGCRDVRTYIQSGNVLFRAGAATAKSASRAVSGKLQAQLGHRIPLVTRSAKELLAVAEAHPLAGKQPDGKLLHVVFLAERPSPAALAGLDPKLSHPDRIEASGREIYLSTPNGLARSKFTNDYFDRRLQSVSTARNWNTVQKLREMIEDGA